MGSLKDESGSVVPVVVVGLGLLSATTLALSGFLRVADVQVQTAAAAEQVALAEAQKMVIGEDGCQLPQAPERYRLLQCEALPQEVSVVLGRQVDLGWIEVSVQARGRYLVGP